MENTTNKGKKCVTYRGFKYRQVYCSANGRNTWRCTVRRCAICIHTWGDDINTIEDTGEEHMHNENVSDVAVVRNACKRRGSDLIWERPAKVIRTVVNSYNDTMLTVSEMHNVRAAIYRERRKSIPALPR